MKMPQLRRDTPGRSPNGRVTLGLLLIGTGRPAGFAQFGGSTAAFLGSLAPLLGFLVVLAGLLAWRGQLYTAAFALLFGLSAMLAPAIIAELFCRAWKREQHWALYANVLNCAQWLMLAVLVLVAPLASLGASLGLDAAHATLLPMAVFVAYILWFHWFTACHVLDLSRGRAAVVMLCVVFGTGLLMQAPSTLAGHKLTEGLPTAGAKP